MENARKYFIDGMDRAEKGYFIRKMINYSLENIEPVLEEKIRLFGSIGRA